MKRKVQVVIIEKSSAANKLIQFRVTAERGGFWQNITGSVEQNESFENAARRELYEECGLNLGPLTDLHLEFSFKDRWGEEVQEKVFLALVTSPRLIRLSSEHQEYRLLPLDKIRPDDFGYISSYEAFLKAKLRAH